MRASFGRCAWGAVAGTIALLCMLGFAPSAFAAFGFSSLSVTPASNDAGANTDVTIAIDIQEPSHDLKDLTIHLPPGLIGNPQATPQCTEAELETDSCPALSDVGDVSNDVTLTVLGFIPVDQTVTGDLYNVVPRAGEPARFGIVLNALPFNVPILGPALLPPIILQSAARLRQSDLGLDTELRDLPNTATVAMLPTAIDINSVSLTLAGMAGSPPQGFIRLPTSCGTHTVGFDATAYDAQTASGQTTFDTSNCGALSFTPELSAHIKQGAEAEAAELTTTISQTIEEAGLKEAKVILPHELSGNASILGVTCPDADFQAGNCPANTIVGSAVAASPLLSQALTGPVSLVTPPTPGLPDLGIDLRGPLALKLKGKVALTADARNQVTFSGLPDIPIAAFSLTFAGGPGGLNIPTRNLCDPPPIVFDATFTSHSGATVNTSPTATVECSGGGGKDHGGKKPRAKIKLGRLGSERPTMKLKVKQGSEKLRQAKLRLPRKLGFASGKRFTRGSSVKARGGKVKVKHTGRSLKLSAKPAAKAFAAKFAGGALKAGKGLRKGAKLKFKLKIRDAAGKTTKLTVRAK
jgi:hypothetical protein